MSNTIEFHDFKEVKPTCSGNYLWAENNWRATKLDGTPTYRLFVHTRYYDTRDNQWRDGYGHAVYDPDQWAEIPMPDPAPDPYPDRNPGIGI